MIEQLSQQAPALDTSTQLAFERTRNSYETTMMSWIRTAARSASRTSANAATPRQ